MNSRERVLLAVDHKPTDRAPADYGALPAVTDGLVAKLGVPDVDGLLDALHVDLRRIGFNSDQSAIGTDVDGYRTTMWGAKVRDTNPKDGLPPLISPFDDSTTVADVHAHEWPDPAALDYSEILPACRKYHDEYATYGSPWSPFFHEVGWLIGEENFLVWMHTKPDVVKALIDHCVDYGIEATRRFLDAADGMLDITYFGNDFGTQRGLYIDPAMWQEFIRAPLKRYFDISHDYGCKVMQHSCGSVRAIIPFLIEDGVDILNPVQVSAAGMELSGLVRDFGNEITFEGGVDTQRTLPFGSADDVRAEVRSYLDLTCERGGYILCSSQEFMEDIPLDNILAMYDENYKRAG